MLAAPRRLLQKVELLPDGGMPAPPYRLVDNDETWLPTTDLVFVDAMGTGYSRPATQDDGAKFWGAEEDLVAFTEFIRAYLIKYNRWTSPLYLAGESYGTFRSAGLATSVASSRHRVSRHLLISSVLSMNTLWEASSANHLPHLTFLPTYTATAWYHGALSAALQAGLACGANEAEEWTRTSTLLPLLRVRLGSTMTSARRGAGLVNYTGLSQSFIEGTICRSAMGTIGRSSCGLPAELCVGAVHRLSCRCDCARWCCVRVQFLAWPFTSSSRCDLVV